MNEWMNERKNLQYQKQGGALSWSDISMYMEHPRADSNIQHSVYVQHPRADQNTQHFNESNKHVINRGSPWSL